jgi:hypothetical protein
MQPSHWRKSSFSADAGECIEVAGTLDELRDSKNATGPALRADVERMVRAIRSGYLTR